MTGFLDSADVAFSCPQCGRVHSKTVGALRRSPHIRCSGCGTMIRIDARQFDSELRGVDRGFDDLQREIDKLNRTLRF